MKVKTVPKCPKCEADVDEKMTFCPKCGAPLQVQQPVDWRERRREMRREWRERRKQLRQQRWETEKGEGAEWEKTEKHEKHEHVFTGPLIGGLILIFFGLMFYFVLVSGAGAEIIWASFFIVVGLIIIAAVIYGVIVAGRRHPKA